jgi:hypothetical protein
MPFDQHEYREEAERLALLSRDEQRTILGMLRECAENEKTPKRERQAGLARVKALELHLRRLKRRRRAR